jgi:hypothetical protein
VTYGREAEYPAGVSTKLERGDSMDREQSEKEKELADQIKARISELNALFKQASNYPLKFDVSFSQSMTLGDRYPEAHLILKAYKEL